LLRSVNGMSIGTPIETPPVVGGMIDIFSGNGQSGLVSFGVMRVSAWMPSISVTALASIFGCAAMARVGFSSSHSSGNDEFVPVPCSGIERHALAHCARAFCTSV